MSIGSTVFKPSSKAKPFIPSKPANPSIMMPQPNMSQQNFLFYWNYRILYSNNGELCKSSNTILKYICYKYFY